MSITKECRDSREQIAVEKLQKLDGTYYYTYPWHIKSKCHPQNIQAEVGKRGLEEADHNSELILNNLMRGAASAQALAGVLDLKPSEVLLYLAYAGAEWDADLQLWRLPKADQELESDRKFSKAKEELKAIKVKYVAAQSRISELESQVESLNGFPATIKRSPIEIIEETDSDQEATALLMASDWHPGKEIKSESVNGLNELNPEIAEQRINSFFSNSQKLIQSLRSGVAIPNVVLWLGGDMIENHLREENVLTNTMTPTEEILFVQAKICAGLDLLLNDAQTKQITVVCSAGNHGRQTMQRKTPVGGRTETSLEQMLYKSIAREYRNTDKIKFQITESYFNFLKVYDKTLCFHHGDNVKFGGGIGGIAVPIGKYLAKANLSIRSDKHIIGHFHQRTSLPGCLINGSLCGYDDYAMSLACSYERPMQTLQLIDNKYGFTVNAPIFVD